MLSYQNADRLSCSAAISCSISIFEVISVVYCLALRLSMKNKKKNTKEPISVCVFEQSFSPRGYFCPQQRLVGDLCSNLPL